MVSCVHLLLAEVDLWHSKCTTNALWSGCAFSSGVQLLICGVNLCHDRCCMSLTWLILCCFTCFTTAHCGCPASSQFLHCYLLGRFHIISGIPLPLIYLSQRHRRCPTSAHWRRGSALFYVFLCHSCVSFCFSKCPSTIHFGGVFSHKCFTDT